MIKPRPDTQALCRAVGACIKRRRRAQGMTLRAMATAISSHRPIVARVERGANACTLDTIQRYAVALGCTASELLAEAEASVRASVGLANQNPHHFASATCARALDQPVQSVHVVDL